MNANLIAQCAASGQMDARQIEAHGAAGELPTCCEFHGKTGGCREGRDCPERQAAKLARVMALPIVMYDEPAPEAKPPVPNAAGAMTWVDATLIGFFISLVLSCAAGFVITNWSTLRYYFSL